MIRPMRYETERYGEYSKPGEFVYDHPFLWGSRRIGPDLAREGGKYNNLWHVNHMKDPRSVTPKSIMPTYPGLLTSAIDWPTIQKHVDGMAMLGVPYGDLVQEGRAIDGREDAGEDHRRRHRGRTAAPRGSRTRRSWRWWRTCSASGIDIKQAGSVAQRPPLLGGF